MSLTTNSVAWAVPAEQNPSLPNCAALLEIETGNRAIPAHMLTAIDFLGKGEHAMAFLHPTDANGPIVKKLYYPNSLDQIRSDFEALRYIERHQDAFPFKLARAFSRHADHMLMEYAPGINLEMLLQSESVSQELKTQLKARYLEKLHQTLKFFEERCFDIQYRSQQAGFGKAQLMVPHGLRAACDSGDLFLEFIIKSDNIVVDLNTLDMTLVDPY